MKNFSLILGLLFSLIALAEPTPPPLNGFEDRQFKVILPQDFQGREEGTRYPLIILLHGYKASGRIQDLYLGLGKQVTPKQFILAIPEGKKDIKGNQFWNATPACCDFYQSGVNDVAFLQALLARLKKDYPVNENKIYLFGHSNGAFMANRMACEIPQQLTGLVTLAGTGFLKEEECRIKGSLKVLHIHGTEDQTILFEGRPGQYPGAHAMVKNWLGRNSCDSRHGEKEIRDFSQLDGSETEILEWNQCLEGNKVVLFQMKGEKHIPLFKPVFLEAVFDFMIPTL